MTHVGGAGQGGDVECADISGRGPGSPVARFRMPFGTMNSVTIRPYEAEFEVKNDQ